jgi:hypothetical protein
MANNLWGRRQRIRGVVGLNQHEADLVRVRALLPTADTRICERQSSTNDE